MNPHSLSCLPSRARIADRELAAGLKKFVDAKYAGIVGAARRAWEREYSRLPDPSDACVSVRISRGRRKLVAA